MECWQPQPLLGISIVWWAQLRCPHIGTPQAAFRKAEKAQQKSVPWAAGGNHPALTSETIPCHVPLSSGPYFTLPSHLPSFMTLEPIHHNIIGCTISSHCTEGPGGISPFCTQVMGWGMSHSAQGWPLTPSHCPLPSLMGAAKRAQPEAPI